MEKIPCQFLQRAAPFFTRQLAGLFEREPTRPEAIGRRKVELGARENLPDRGYGPNGRTATLPGCDVPCRWS